MVPLSSWTTELPGARTTLITVFPLQGLRPRSFWTTVRRRRRVPFPMSTMRPMRTIAMTPPQRTAWSLSLGCRIAAVLQMAATTPLRLRSCRPLRSWWSMMSRSSRRRQITPPLRKAIVPSASLAVPLWIWLRPRTRCLR